MTSCGARFLINDPEPTVVLVRFLLVIERRAGGVMANEQAMEVRPQMQVCYPDC